MTTKEIISNQKKLQEDVKDIEIALKSLRGSNWKEGVSEDKRGTVILLYEQYLFASKALDKFENTEWTDSFKKRDIY
jgi:hypothetical protein